jgi:membrane-associated HD superfamily phosphohydrolase
MDKTLSNRFRSLQDEMVEQLELTAAIENHWLIYALLGIEHLVTCCASHYLLHVRHQQVPRSPYVALWLLQILLTWGTVRLISGRPRTEESPFEPLIKRIWTVFIFLCINIAVLNVVSGEPIFVFMPALATLSSFAFACLTTFVSRRFSVAGFAMFATGLLMAKFKSYQFLIYGAGWFVVLEALSVTLWFRRRRWIITAPAKMVANSSPQCFTSSMLSMQPSS